MKSFEKGCAGGGVDDPVRVTMTVSQHIWKTTQESHGSSLGFGTVSGDGSVEQVGWFGASQVV